MQKSKKPSPVPPQSAFHFYRDIGALTGKSASSLEEFSHQLETVDAESIEFHMRRGDFEKWVEDTLHKEKLAKRIETIKTLGLRGEKLRKAVHGEVQRNMLSRPYNYHFCMYCGRETGKGASYCWNCGKALP